MFRTRTVLLVAIALIAPLAAQNQVLQLSNTGSSGWFDVPSAPGLGPANITVEAWITYDETTIVAPPSWSWPTVLRKNVGAGGEEYFLRIQSANSASRTMRWRVRTNTGTVDANWSFPAGRLLNWTHVAGTWDGLNARLFIDGVEVATGTGSGPLVNNAGVLKIGAGDSSPGAAPELWNGGIDDVRIWSVARTEAEIRSNMFVAPFGTPGLEAAWQLEGDALDWSGNNQHGTLTAPATFTTATLPVQRFQSNSAAASFDIDGVAGGPFVSASVSSLVGTPSTLSIDSSLIPTSFDLALTAPQPLVGLGSGGFSTAGGQIVNVDVTAPSLTLAFSGSFGRPFVPFTAPLVATLNPGAALDLAAQVLVLDPTHPDGFQLSGGLDYSVQACFTSWDMESLAARGPGLLPQGLTDGGGTAQWSSHAGGTTSGATGPTTAFGGSNYLYCETSGAGGTSTFVFDTCNVDVGGLTTFNLDFALSRIGASIGTLRILQDDGTGAFATVLATYTGPDPLQAQGATEWSNESLFFIPTGPLVAFRFEYTGGGTFTGDLAIDDLNVR